MAPFPFSDQKIAVRPKGEYGNPDSYAHHGKRDGDTRQKRVEITAVLPSAGKISWENLGRIEALTILKRSDSHRSGLYATGTECAF